MEWYIEAIEKYADFSGRARRREYWMFKLINLLILAALAAVDIFVIGAPFFSLPYLFAIVIPSIAVTVRRFHDIGVSGWLYPIVLVPGGWIVLFIVTVLDGDPGPNRYGPSPKQAGILTVGRGIATI